MRFVLLCLLCTFLSCGKSPLSNSDSSSKPIIESLRGGDRLKVWNYSVTLKYDGQPVLYQNNSAIVFIRNEKGEFTNIKEEFLFDLWMPDHGHGSGKIDVENISVGIYKLSRISFIMPGDWILRLSLFSDGTIFKQDSWSINF